jgi:Family of unknown function (DUF5343)
MPVTKDAPGPYAPATTTLNIIERYRDRGLPTPITAEVLTRASVPESLIPRTIQTFRILDLIDERGMPTQTFEAIKLAPEADYKATLAKWLEATYADVLQFVDPVTATETQLADAFRHYTPQGQRPRMITLFSGLFRAAGIGPEKPSAPPRKGRPATPSRAEAGRRLGQIIKTGTNLGTGAARGNIRLNSELHPALAGVLASLPNHWTQAERDKFMAAFGAVLDFVVPIVAENAVVGGQDAPA